MDEAAVVVVARHVVTAHAVLATTLDGDSHGNVAVAAEASGRRQVFASSHTSTQTSPLLEHHSLLLLTLALRARTQTQVEALVL